MFILNSVSMLNKHIITAAYTKVIYYVVVQVTEIAVKSNVLASEMHFISAFPSPLSFFYNNSIIGTSISA